MLLGRAGTGPKTRRSRLPLIMAALAGLAALVLAVHFLPRLVYRQVGHLALGKEAGRLEPGGLALVREILGGQKARVAWSSSRSGNHEIYLMDLPGGNLRQLTDHPHVDYFPRFSPDGEKIVFARSREKWVSERKADPWDVYLLDLSTGREKLLAEWGNNPQWVDPNRVSFLRGGREVFVLDLRTGREKKVFGIADAPVGGGVLQTPELCRENPRLLAFTGDGKADGSAVVELNSGKLTRFGPGCEITFLPGCQKVLWVENGGRQKTRIMISKVARPDPHTLLDLPGEFSHEYFPRASRDGRWLVFGASSGGHEHDIADYEIFLWRVGDAPQKAVRLTRNRGNDRWPDIHLYPAR